MSGQLNADGGKIVMLSVPAAAGVVNEAINLSGNAKGDILLLAGGGKADISGSIDARAPTARTQGGQIRVHAKDIQVRGTARLDVSGAAGAGDVSVGGKLTAADCTATSETSSTIVESGAILSACGAIGCPDDGGAVNGGKVRLYSSTTRTELAGTVNVSAGKLGNAGEVKIISDQGEARFAGTGRIVARTGAIAGLDNAGFAVIVGNTL